VSDTVQCATHGETGEAFVCAHLNVDSVSLGFNRDDPDDEDPFPEAWCDNCEIIHAAYGEWNDESLELTKFILLCTGCYERARIRNTRTAATLDDFSSLRWKCGSCDEWHTGICLDAGFSQPYYWSNEFEKGSRWIESPEKVKEPSSTFLDSEYCAVEGENFFVRGLILLPILGTAETYCWGVWGSHSRENFEKLLHADDTKERVESPPMFSWLSTKIPGYPDTLGLKMYAHVRDSRSRPEFRLEESEHPLAQEFHHGITPERAKELMFLTLPAQE
jgi:hypothetical protein